MKNNEPIRPKLKFKSFAGILLIVLTLSFTSCQKYLDAKPNQAISTPSTIDDLDAILDAYFTINARYPSASEVASDDFYLLGADFNGLSDQNRSYYSWQKQPNFLADYGSPYQGVEYANVLLETTPKIPGDESRKNIIYGNALFVRASYHYAIAQLYAKVYNVKSASSDLGIVLRLTSDITVRPVRSTVEETYQSIIKDLKRSVNFLPVTPAVKYRSGKQAAFGLLARVYLSMSDFKSAELYADSALSINSTLIDYNTLSSAAAIPFKQFNAEVIYDTRALPAAALSQSRARIDTNLYASYATNDLRKTVLFKTNANGSRVFKGSYTGVTGASLFNGIATDELFFIRAETAIRNGETDKALDALNTVLINRWKKGTFIPFTIKDPKDLLDLILRERRKELLFRTLRWTDLRRLNLEADRMKTLTRNLAGTIYTLEPNGLRYVFQIEQNSVDISGFPQNP